MNKRFYFEKTSIGHVYELSTRAQVELDRFVHLCTNVDVVRKRALLVYAPYNFPGGFKSAEEWASWCAEDAKQVGIPPFVEVPLVEEGFFFEEGNYYMVGICDKQVTLINVRKCANAKKVFPC
ncbi:MAG: hypothetical protein IKV15_04645 [Bacteroidaceae bacterium]|nr:hypothetical protein [Bacteroidaceae bacterium]